MIGTNYSNIAFYFLKLRSVRKKRKVGEKAQKEFRKERTEKWEEIGKKCTKIKKGRKKSRTCG